MYVPHDRINYIVYFINMDIGYIPIYDTETKKQEN
jgi:hypothetical protein